MSPKVSHTITQGDTAHPLGAQLVRRRDGQRVVIDLSGATVLFAMVDSEDATTVEETSDGVTIVDAQQGHVQFTFSPEHVATPGTYYGWFIRDVDGAQEHFPADGKKLEIVIVPKLHGEIPSP